MSFQFVKSAQSVAFYYFQRLFSLITRTRAKSSRAAASGSALFMMAETTAMPSMGLPFKTSMFPAFKPPMATTGIGTLRQTSFRRETGVSTVFTFVVVGKIAPVPR